MSEWRDRTAVVTGGGRGFGAAFGFALAREGATVVLVDTDEAAAKETASALLSSRRARFVTGEILRVTGGMGAGL